MTHEEREAEAKRLMALLSGEGGDMMITEEGTLEAWHGAAPETVELYCQHCAVALDDGSGIVIDGDLYCEACTPRTVFTSWQRRHRP